LPEYGADLLAGIAERGEFVIPVGAVYNVVDGDKPDVFLGIHDFSIKANLLVIAPEVGHILDDDRDTFPSSTSSIIR
jgi:hypothetical protein